MLDEKSCGVADSSPLAGRFCGADEGKGEREGEAELGGGLASFGVFLIFAGTAYYALTKRGGS
ncbi:hypothetical protein [Thermococcus sp. JCM 11816]|uniref:hypothetical protein n=1 Tax=Thermococcus sp. (strain JCM 11816 / KS-1) TaxID=1295125 RepID=UPI0006D0675C